MTGEDQQQQTAAPDEGAAPAARKAEPSPEPKDEGPSLSDLGAAAAVEAERTSQVAPAAPPAAPAPAPAPVAKAAKEPEPEEPVYANTIFAVKTSIGHERIVADAIENKAMRKGSEIFGILCPQPMRGYIFIEARNPDALQELLKGVKKVRGIVRGEGGIIPMDQIEHFLAPKPLVSGIVEGNIVELIAGPFKGEKARVQQIDEAKEEITVELFEAMISIPITVRGDHVRVIEKELK
jgi:transcriptional antiterminator NusG